MTLARWFSACRCIEAQLDMNGSLAHVASRTALSWPVRATQGARSTVATITRSVSDLRHATINSHGSTARGSLTPKPSRFPTRRPSIRPASALRVQGSARSAATGGTLRSHSYICSAKSGSHPSGLDQSGFTQGTGSTYPRSWETALPYRSLASRSSASAPLAATGSSSTHEASEGATAMEPVGSGVNASSMGGQPPVAMITTIGCPYCRKAKAALNQAGIDFEEIDLSGQLQLLDQIKALTGRTSVPQVFLAGLLIGGAVETLAAIADGSFQSVLEGGNVGPALPPSLRDSVDRALRQTPEGAKTVPKQLLPEGMHEQRYKTLKILSKRIHQGLVPGGNNMFTVAEGVDWLRSRGQVATPEAALTMLADMQRAHLLYVSDASGADLSTVDTGASEDPRTGLASAPAATANTALQLVTDAPQPQFGEPMNVAVPWYGDARPASQVAEGLRRLILRLYDTHLAEDGSGVSYKSLMWDPAFKDYITATGELQQVDLGQLSREERTAFFINIYNALVVHGLTLFGAPSSTLQRLRWFSAVKYRIGGLNFSANDIEHGCLRANSASPASIGSLLGIAALAQSQFPKGDPRLPLVVEPLDPRVHFTLVCGAKSCPPIRIYTPASLEPGLEAASQAFCSGEVEVDRRRRQVTLSMIFKWYKGDFGPPEVLLPWLLQYIPPEQARELEAMLAADGGAATIKVGYRPYDWSVNTLDE